jgi:PKD repeat protein
MSQFWGSLHTDPPGCNVTVWRGEINWCMPAVSLNVTFVKTLTGIGFVTAAVERSKVADVWVFARGGDSAERARDEISAVDYQINNGKGVRDRDP